MIHPCIANNVTKMINIFDRKKLQVQDAFKKKLTDFGELVSSYSNYFPITVAPCTSDKKKELENYGKLN